MGGAASHAATGAIPHATAEEPIARALARAHAVLPDQGPIGVFIHHNTLHAFQHLPFHEAVQAGAAAYRAQPYWTLAQFAAAHRDGRIAIAALRAEIRAELGTEADVPLAIGTTRGALWQAWMTSELPARDRTGLEFAVATGAATAGLDPDLWQASLARLARAPARQPRALRQPTRHREAMLALGAEDPDDVVHAELVRLGAAFLDQGQAHTPLPERERGFLAAVAQLHQSGAHAPRACRPGDRDLIDSVARGLDGQGVIAAALDALAVPEPAREAWLFATALALPGWAGMFARLERHPAENHVDLPVRLAEFLAVRLCYERRAIEHACARAGLPSTWPELLAHTGLTREDDGLDALILVAAAQAAGLSADTIAALPDAALAELWTERDRCAPLVRRRLWQEAYERHYREQILGALAARRRRGLAQHVVQPRAQFVFCIDEREESLRRALEEQATDFVTYGTAGFFGVAIDYLGLDDRVPVPHAPVVVTPSHEVHERPRLAALERHAKRARLRQAWNRLERAAAARSRGLLGGAGAALVLGPLAGAIAALRVVAPRLSLGMRDRARRSLVPEPATRLSAVRTAADATALTPRGKPLGFSAAEASERVAKTLENLGLVRDFAPIVVILGHGSTSLNNPHESAHDCGACGGRRGGANARVFAELANRPDVRAGVAARGIVIPEHTWFVGALHDTADDAVLVYDLDVLPAHAEAAFQVARDALERARRESARERCRRFEAAPLGLSPEAALQHVEVRSTALSQPRPEYGHCTNAIAIVGRRELSRGLHFDRRPFLISYDPSIDRDDAILERILAAVGPVGAGINLEYYFSSVDNEVFGCGTKLPHNVTGLLGVMAGHNGDLRTGLPLQMVEIHEPMRLLLIVEATPESLLAIAARQAELAELVTNRWVQLVSVDPRTGAMQVLDKEPGVSGRASRFVPFAPGPTELPEVERSTDWHGRTRAHLPPALVRAALAPAGDAR